MSWGQVLVVGEHEGGQNSRNPTAVWSAMSRPINRVFEAFVAASGSSDGCLKCLRNRCKHPRALETSKLAINRGSVMAESGNILSIKSTLSFDEMRGFNKGLLLHTSGGRFTFW